MGRITVFSAPNCTYCTKVKDYLLQSRVPFTEINLDSFPHRFDEMVRMSNGKSSVPQIFFNEIHIGGCSELMELLDQGKLDDMIQECFAGPDPSWEELALPVAGEKITKAALSLSPNDHRQWVIEDTTVTYDQMVSLIQQHVPISDRRVLLKSYPKSFIGSDLVYFLISHFHISKERALAMGHQLMDDKLFSSVTNEKIFRDGQHLYQLQTDKKESALNMKRIWMEPVDNKTVAEKLRQAVSDLFDKFMFSDGMDYSAMVKSRDFQDFEVESCKLQKVDLGSLSAPEKTAFCINIYNVCIIHAFASVEERPDNAICRMRFFSTVGYNIGGMFYSLDDIEHGILRSNKKGPGKFSKQFRDDDPRSKFSICPMDPRIHFALNCGAKSCPPIRVFTVSNLEVALDAATKAFLENTEIERDTVTITKLFKWYGEDFGKGVCERLAWLANNLPASLAGKLQASLQTYTANKLKFRYLEYDWSSNERPTCAR